MIRRTVIALTLFSMLCVGIAGAEEDRRLSYPELGLVFSGALAQPSVGYWWGRTGVRLSGMYYARDWYEAHLNIGYAFHDGPRVQHCVNLLTNRVVGSDPGSDYSYWSTGIAYSLNYRGFFLELGLAYPWRDEIGNLADDFVVPCGYLGYIYRFR